MWLDRTRPATVLSFFAVLLDQIHPASVRKHICDFNFCHLDTVLHKQRRYFFDRKRSTTILIKLFEHGVDIRIRLDLTSGLMVILAGFTRASRSEPGLEALLLQLLSVPFVRLPHTFR